MKNNQKGFALVETLIVSIVVAGILVYLFVQFSTLKRNYNTSFKYNTVNDLYALEDVYDYINDLSAVIKKEYIIDSISSNGYVYIHLENDIYTDNVDSYEMILDGYAEDLFNVLDIEQLIITNEDLSSLNTNDFDQGMIKFIDKISYDGTSDYRLIAKFKDNTYANLVFRLEVD